MVLDMVKVDFPGLIVEHLPSGNRRYRVRVEGKKKKRITLSITPDHDDFSDHYKKARRGEKVEIEAPPSENMDQRELRWLIQAHLEHMGEEVKAGTKSAKTLKKRTGLLNRVSEKYGDYERAMPAEQVIKIQDEMASTPAMADSMVEAIRVMYRWAMKRGYVDANPAIDVEKIDQGKGGAIAWTKEDLQAYLKHHKKGTNAHVALSVLAFTGCRVGDLCHLGRHIEFLRNGVRGLDFQPGKKGSARVIMPMVAPLYEATRAPKVQGETYVLTFKGKPLSSPDSASAQFKKWCQAAGLQNRSAHGIRKGLAELLAECGCSQYEIMAILGHTEAKTSEVYTRGVERWNLSVNAMARTENMPW